MTDNAKELMAESLVNLINVDYIHKNDVKRYVMTSADYGNPAFLLSEAETKTAPVNTMPLELRIIEKLDLERVKFVKAPITEVGDRTYQVQTVQFDVNAPDIDVLSCDIREREMEQLVVNSTVEMIEKYVEQGKDVYIYKLFSQLAKLEKTKWVVQHRLFTIDKSVTL